MKNYLSPLDSNVKLNPYYFVLLIFWVLYRNCIIPDLLLSSPHGSIAEANIKSYRIHHRPVSINLPRFINKNDILSLEMNLGKNV